MKNKKNQLTFDYFAEIPNDSLVIFFSQDPHQLAKEMAAGSELGNYFKFKRIKGIILNSKIEMECLTKEQLKEMGLKIDTQEKVEGIH